MRRRVAVEIQVIGVLVRKADFEDAQREERRRAGETDSPDILLGISSGPEASAPTPPERMSPAREFEIQSNFIGILGIEILQSVEKGGCAWGKETQTNTHTKRTDKIQIKLTGRVRLCRAAATVSVCSLTTGLLRLWGMRSLSLSLSIHSSDCCPGSGERKCIQILRLF